MHSTVAVTEVSVLGQTVAVTEVSVLGQTVGWQRETQSLGMNLKEDDIYAVALGHLVAEIRKRKGLTQGQLAEMLGVAQSTVSRIEKGQVMPNAYLLRQIAAAFEMDSGDLTRMVEEVLERSKKAAHGAGLRGAVTGVPWWTVALGVAGFGGILGLIGYAVGAALHDYLESRKRTE